MMLAGMSLCGCAPAWRPPLTISPPDTAPPSVALAAYLPRDPGRPRIYQRRNPAAPETPPDRYVRACAPAALIEGSLVGRVNQPITQYLEPIAPAGNDPAQVSWPQTGPGGAAFFLVLDPPLPPYPDAVSTDSAVDARTTVHWFDYRGRAVMDGTLERTVRLEGREPITLPRGQTVDCIRLHIETRIRFAWGPRVNVTEYVWLARGLGDIRRIERLHGLAWLLPFDAVRQYDLISPQPSNAMLATARAQRTTDWSTIAVHLDRIWPAPRVAGLAVEFASLANATPTTKTATAPQQLTRRRPGHPTSIRDFLHHSARTAAGWFGAPTRTHK
jgi:hypothetical protein